MASFITYDAATGRVIVEQYLLNDKLHRGGGKPARVSYDATRAIVTDTEYFELPRGAKT